MIAVILNAGAGGTEDETPALVSAEFDKLGASYQIYLVEESEAADDVAVRAMGEGAQILCACGGDGTVSGVVNGILRSGSRDVALAVIPRGTGNLVAEALGIPKDLPEACAVAVSGMRASFDVGKVGTEYFALGLGMGVTERFVTLADGEEKEKLGRLAYLVGLFKALGLPRYRLELSVDGKPQPTTLAAALTVANFWGKGGFQVVEGTRPDDGQMEAVVNRKMTLANLIRAAWLSLWGRLDEDPNVTIVRGSHFAIQSDPPMPFQLDGNDAELENPVAIEVLPKALTALLPTPEKAE